MKRHHKHALPRKWMNHPYAKGMIAEGDLKVCHRGRLKCKVMVFESAKAMGHFWHKVFGQRGAAIGAAGLCSAMSYYDNKNGKSTEWVDPNYFAVIGLVKSKLKLEAVSHECTHAAFFYAERSNKKWPNQDVLIDEKICYPQGRLMRNMTIFLHEAKLWH